MAALLRCPSFGGGIAAPHTAIVLLMELGIDGSGQLAHPLAKFRIFHWHRVVRFPSSVMDGGPAFLGPDSAEALERKVRLQVLLRPPKSG